MEKEKITVNKDGITVSASVIDTFTSDKGNEYLVYSFEDDEVQVSRIVESETDIKLETVPEEDNVYVTQKVEEILEDL